MRSAAVVAATLWLCCMGAGGVRADDNPFIVGESIGRWQIVRQQQHPEFVRFFLREPSAPEFGVEIVIDDAPAGDWRTGRHRLMPAPDSNPPRELLVAVMQALRRYDEGQNEPLVASRRNDSDRGFLPRDPRRNLSLFWLLLAVLAVGHPSLRARRGDASDRAPGDVAGDREGSSSGRVSLSAEPGAAATAPGDPDFRWPWVLLPLAILLVAVALRLPLLKHGVLSDEIAWMWGRSFDTVAWGGETAVNPPLLRLLFNLPLDLEGTLAAGRGWSLIAGSLAVPLLFYVGRVMGVGRVSSTISALALAVFPLAIMQAGWYRSYATWLLLATWHGLAVVQIARRKSERGRWTFQLALSALLLVQVHYFSVPMLFFEGLLLAWYFRSVWLVSLYVPAALGFFTWVPAILHDSKMLHPPDRVADIVSNIERITSMGIGPPASLLVCLAVPALLWRWLDSPRRALLLCNVAVVGGAVAMAPWHLVRPDAGIYSVPFVLPLLTSLPDLVRPLPVRVVAWIALPCIYLGVVEPHLRHPYLPREPEAMVEFASQWSPEEGGSLVFLHPEHSVSILAWSLDRDLLYHSCDWRGYRCYRRSEAELFVGLPEPVLPEPGTLVTPLYTTAAPTLAGGSCEVAREGSAHRLWRCR